ncbi:MAG: type II secretion system F family protein [Actinomycetaceae bacterium]|nr:type II secretion system F family protein [Actinomycetaceae bacterium]
MSVIIGLLFTSGITLIWRAVSGAPHIEIRFPLTWSHPLYRHLVRAGLNHTQRQLFYMVSAGIPALSFTTVYSLTHTWAVALAVALALAPLPWSWLKRKHVRNRTQMIEAWPTIVDLLLSAVRAGVALPEAVLQLANSGPEITRPYFQVFAREYRASGRFSQALSTVQAELLDSTGDQIFEVLRLARELGGNELGNLLRDLSTVMRDDARIRGEIIARQSWTVNAARIAVAAPWIVLVLISTRTDAAAAYSTLTGATILATGGFFCAIAYWLMQRIGTLEDFGGR